MRTFASTTGTSSGAHTAVRCLDHPGDDPVHRAQPERPKTEDRRPKKTYSWEYEPARRCMMVDPTAIDIDFDPTVQRMKGVTVHGGMPFDVPIITEIGPNLWQGGCQDGLILPCFVRHLVSLYLWEHYRVQHELDSVLIVRMYDSEEQTFEQIEALARWVNVCRTTGPGPRRCREMSYL